MATELPEGFGSTPFLKFYHGQWQDMLDTVIVPDEAVPGHGDLSWDRRAAYLLWCMSKRIKPEFTLTNHYRGYPYKFDTKGRGYV